MESGLPVKYEGDAGTTRAFSGFDGGFWVRSTGGAAIAREELVEVNGCLREPRRILPWHFGHWIVNRYDKCQNSFDAISQIFAIRPWAKIGNLQWQHCGLETRLEA